jgi:hypothetical protein
LRGCRVGDAGLIHLKQVTSITGLGIGTNVTDAGLAHLSTKLEELQLTGNQKVTDAGLVHLARLVNLRNLELQGTQVTAARVAQLQKSLPKCKIVR